MGNCPRSLFHFHRIFKNGGGGSEPLETSESGFATVLIQFVDNFNLLVPPYLIL